MIEEPGHFRPHRAERVIAAGRLFLAVFLLVAIHADPTEAGGFAAQMRILAVAYLIYAAALTLLVWIRRTVPSGVPLAAHVADLVLFSVFMYFSQGAASPFFVYFVFATICGALRWHGKGALYTGIAALAAYVTVTFGATTILPGAEVDTGRFITRCTQLAVITLLLAYVGHYQQRLQAEIASLAAWPRRLPPGRTDAVRDVLARAAAVLHARRAVLAWQEGEEPSLHVAWLEGYRFELSREAPDAFGTLVAGALERSSFFCQQEPAGSSFVVRRVPGGNPRGTARRSIPPCRRVTGCGACSRCASRPKASTDGSSPSTVDRSPWTTCCSATSSAGSSRGRSSSRR